MIQGFGNVGYWASKFIVENGGIIIGVAEFNSGIVCPAGIDPDKLLRYKEENDTLCARRLQRRRRPDAGAPRSRQSSP